MAVKIRLARRGRKKAAMYDVVVADVRAPRDGRFIEKLGTYNPNTNPASININTDSALKWVMDGAQPTDTARGILSETGVMYKKHLQVGVNKGAITQEQADEKYSAWITDKESKTQGKVDSLTKAKDDVTKSKLDAEAKINATRAEGIAKRNLAIVEEAKAVEAAAIVAAAPAPEEVAETTEEAPAAEAKEETPAAEAPKEEAPVAEAPKEEAPVAEVPKEEAPVAEAPKEEAPKEEKAAE